MVEGRKDNILVSLTNSGESFEKALCLSYLASASSRQFYSNYTKVISCYDENLPKKNKSLLAHGTVGYFIRYLSNLFKSDHKSIEDLWDNRTEILEKLISLSRISQRTAEKLIANPERFSKTISQFPWYVLFPDHKETLYTLAKSKIPNLEMTKLDLKLKLPDLVQKLPSYTPISKVYFLNPDGEISSRSISKSVHGLNRGTSLLLKESIVCSGNIYVLIRQVLEKIQSDAIFPEIGYRPLTRFPRKTYNMSISHLQLAFPSLTEEPRNSLFSDKLNKMPLELPQEEKTNIAIYQTIKELMD